MSSYISELREYSFKVLKLYFRYRELIEKMPYYNYVLLPHYEDCLEAYSIYKEILQDIQVDQLNNQQHIEYVNIINKFDYEFDIIIREIDIIKNINIKYKDNHIERQKQLDRIIFPIIFS